MAADMHHPNKEAAVTPAAAAATPATPATPASRTTRPEPPPKNRNAIRDGDRDLRQTANQFGEEFRELRLRAGVSQAAVARSIGVARSVICRLEAGDNEVGIRIRARAASLLGATLKLAIYADGDPLIRDAAHARLVEALLALRHRRWQATVEAPVPGPGRRSTDVRLERGADLVLCEVESRLRRLEEIVREVHDKRESVRTTTSPGTRVHAVLVLPPTRHHRSLVRAHPETIRAAFPTRSSDLRAALQAPNGQWPGDGLLWLAAGRTVGGDRRVTVG